MIDAASDGVCHTVQTKMTHYQSTPLTTISVIGGGSVAASWCYHLIEALSDQPGLATSLRLRIHEPRPQIGRGVAYADDLQSNLLNVTVGAMSVAGDDKGHFQRWLTAQGISMFEGRPITAASFVSRELFGRYLEAVVNETLDRSRALGVLIEHQQQLVTSVVPAPNGGWLVSGSDGQSHKADRVVIALGNLDSTRFSELRAQPGYAASPYPTATLLEGLDPQATVGILGTSLSAVDAIVGLVARGHRGTIYAVSRNGRLPSVRGVLNPAWNISPSVTQVLADCHRCGTQLSLEDLIRLLHGELASVGGMGAESEDLSRIAFEVPDAAAFLDEEIRLAQTQPRPWQAVGNALNACVDLAWHVLDEEGRARFEREWRSAWMARRVSFPLENALALRRLMDEGRLHVKPGFERAELIPGGGFELVLRAPLGSPATHIAVDRLIDATGFTTDVRSSNLPLLVGMLADGLASPDPYGGVCVDFDTGALRRADRSLEPTITVLGSLAAGTYFWTNAMEINARLALGQARRLIEAIACEQ